MQKISIIILLGFIAFASCKKNNSQNCSPLSVPVPASEIDSLRAYISSNNITATEDSRGFFYSITAAGSGTKPTVCNTVTVNYKGSFTSGEQFETNNGVTFSLNQLIAGWQEGIPLIAPGGSIILYLPPTLAYGSSGQGTIPPNSILVFDIDLVAVQ